MSILETEETSVTSRREGFESQRGPCISNFVFSYIISTYSIDFTLELLNHRQKLMQLKVRDNETI